MAFCSKCGKELTNGAQFCSQCGTSAHSEGVQRKMVYEGEIHLCPRCGKELKAFEVCCPHCQFELRGKKVSNSVKEFSEKLEKATTERQKIDLIKCCPIPNTKEDILEFIIVASTNFDISYYATHLHEEDISDAWLAKIEQCYQKAKILFEDSEEFQTIQSVYSKIEKECQQIKEKTLKQERDKNAKIFLKSPLAIFIVVFTVIYMLFCCVSFNDGHYLSASISIFMIFLNILAFLMGCNIIKEKITNLKLVLVIFALILVIVYFSVYGAGL